MLALLAALVLDTATAPCPRGVLPAYAHNDYANTRPLHDALLLGFRGVEADVAMVDGTLRLGHDRDEARRGTSFERTYLAPLAALVTRCGHLTVDGSPFLLTVELKDREAAAADSLDALLMRYLPQLVGAHASRPSVDVVLVGWCPPGRSATGIGRQHRLRTPSDVEQVTDFPAEVRLVSVDYGKTIGRPWRTRAGRRRWFVALRSITAQPPVASETANRLDPARDPRSPLVRVRVHNVPVRAAIYRELLDAGVRLIGTKDLLGTARALEPLVR